MFKELENALVGLLIHKRFFAEVIARCQKVYTDKIPTAGVSVGRDIKLLINTEFFKSLSPLQRIELLEHECLHLIRGHCTSRAVKQHQIWNIATDCSINQTLPELCKFEGGVTLKSFRKLTKSENFKAGDSRYIEPSRESEYYYQKLMEAIDDGRTETKKIPSTLDDHDSWQGEGEEGEEVSGELKDALVKDMLNKSEKATKNAGGQIPYEIQKHLNRWKSSTIDWKRQLKEFFNSVTHADKRKSRMKRNRRYGTMFPGKKKEHKYNIVVAVDESGSVYDSLLETFFSEIDKMSMECATLHVLHCDTQVNAFYPYKKGMEIKRTGCGGTAYNPVFDYLKGKDIDGVVFFGDGDCFENEIIKPKFKVLWALPEHGSNPSNFGKVVRVVENESK